MPIREFKVEKSQFPEGDKKWLVVMYSKSEHGYNIQIVFKGTKAECEEERKRRMEEYKNGRSNNQTRIRKTRI